MIAPDRSLFTSPRWGEVARRSPKGEGAAGEGALLYRESETPSPPPSPPSGRSRPSSTGDGGEGARSVRRQAMS